MREKKQHYEFCVVGGGMAGTIAAITAARHGTKTALIQDRPMLGGNASSEIRMHVCGAHGENNRETGVLEEMFLENHYRNPLPNYSIWDSVVYGKAKYQEGLDVYLNASVCDLTMDGDRVESVRAWQFTSETWLTISADLFADCTGDGILAPLSGAEYRVGREARDEYDESIAPVESDKKTMGLSCLFQAREYDHPRPFIPPDWAYKFRKEEDLHGRGVDIRKTNYWWLEVGGDKDSIHDTEELRDELLRIAFGVFDYVKNYSPRKDEFANWDLDWQGFLPGKRESRRYVGDHVLIQSDIEAGGHFEDVVAHGGWSMDDHFPAGFYHPEKGTIFHPAPSPYGIPYRTLYSRNITNLFCAGRDHSASHVAMSSTRVMATCSTMGQAVGTAAAIAAREKTNPRGVYQNHLPELQETLMEDDAWLPFSRRPVSALTVEATITERAAVGAASRAAGNPAAIAKSGEEGEALRSVDGAGIADSSSTTPAGGTPVTAGVEALRNGIDRPNSDGYNGWIAPTGAAVEYSWTQPVPATGLRFVFDSDLNRKDEAHGRGYENKSTAKNMRHYYALDLEPWSVPQTLVKTASIEVDYGDGQWTEVARLETNYQRLARLPLDLGGPVKRLRITPTETWGDDNARIFSIDVV